jgi:hypothetical protein
MTPAERTAKIASYGRAAEELTAALKEFPRHMWKYRPGPERWSIHEIIIHLAEAEANSFIRARVFLAEPGKTVMAYNQEKWAKFLNYHDQDPDLALDVFKYLRKSTHAMLQSAPENVWERTIVHPEAGIMTFDSWLTIYEHHTPAHIEQMRRNHEAWKQKK